MMTPACLGGAFSFVIRGRDSETGGGERGVREEAAMAGAGAGTKAGGKWGGGEGDGETGRHRLKTLEQTGNSRQPETETERRNEKCKRRSEVLSLAVQG